MAHRRAILRSAVHALHIRSFGRNEGAPVMTLIHGGGHVYPEQVSRMIVDFFRKYTLAGASGQQHD